jgi:polyisoprenoid-binding protein YceI
MLKSTKYIAAAFVLLGFVACSKESDENYEKIEPIKVELPIGLYNLDKSHASLIFKVNHLGLSKYTASFKNFNAELELDPENPEKSKVNASIDPTSIETNYPEPEKLDFNLELQNDKWLDAVKFPKITFKSTAIKLTSATTADIKGDLSMHGFTQEIILHTTFNGGYAANAMDPSGSRVGFSAHGSLKRSDFGILFGIPEEGSNMGVSDEVEFIIEAEFTKQRKDNNVE